jgi:type 1 glutamine amidotransferase
MNRILSIALVSALLLASQAVWAADKAPRALPKGERVWPPVPEAEVEKIQAALPDKPQVPPKKPRKLLVFYGKGHSHDAAIPVWNKMLELLGEKTGAYQATLSQNYDALEGERLKGFDAVFFNNTNGNTYPEAVKTDLPQFVRSGKGLAGNHGSGCHDSYADKNDKWWEKKWPECWKMRWPEGLEMVSASMVSHPFGGHQVKIDDPQSPLTAVFGGKGFRFSDEMYLFKEPYSREKLRVLLSIDYPNSPDVQKREESARKKGGEAQAHGMRDDHDYAIAWIRPWGQGRVFYCSYGHEKRVAWDSAIVRFFLAGIQYALGDLKADDTPVGAAKK